VHVGILSREPKGSSRRLQDAFEGAGHRVSLLDTYRVTIEVGPAGARLWHQGQPLDDLEAVVPRIGHSATFHGSVVMRQLEHAGVYMTASAQALLASRDKLHGLQVLARAGVPVPRTCYVQRRQDLREAILRIGAPLIVKILEGTQGRGVLLAETPELAEAMAETLLGAERPVLLQHFVAESRGRDVRAFVVGDEVVVAARRVARGDEYRTNVHLGAKAERVELEPSFRECALRAARAMGLEVAGVDMLEGRAGPLVTEVNSSPSVVGIEELGADVAGAIVEHVEKRCS